MKVFAPRRIECNGNTCFASHKSSGHQPTMKREKRRKTTGSSRTVKAQHVWVFFFYDFLHKQTSSHMVLIAFSYLMKTLPLQNRTGGDALHCRFIDSFAHACNENPANMAKLRRGYKRCFAVYQKRWLLLPQKRNHQ